MIRRAADPRGIFAGLVDAVLRLVRPESRVPAAVVVTASTPELVATLRSLSIEDQAGQDIAQGRTYVLRGDPALEWAALGGDLSRTSPPAGALLTHRRVTVTAERPPEPAPPPFPPPPPRQKWPRERVIAERNAERLLDEGLPEMTAREETEYLAAIGWTGPEGTR